MRLWVRRKLTVLALVTVASMVGGVGCREKAPNDTPEGAVKELVERMRRLDGSPGKAKSAYELVSKKTKENLVQRAERYSQASGKHIEPEMMLAPASFIERFRSRTLQAEISGKYAIVHARGLLDEEVANVPCIYEDGGWRVHIELPPLPAEVVRSREQRPATPRPR